MGGIRLEVIVNFVKEVGLMTIQIFENVLMGLVDAGKSTKTM